jgi:hypothetical protein
MDTPDLNIRVLKREGPAQVQTQAASCGTQGKSPQNMVYTGCVVELQAFSEQEAQAVGWGTGMAHAVHCRHRQFVELQCLSLLAVHTNNRRVSNSHDTDEDTGRIRMPL